LKKYTCVFSGRLGNNLFQLATLIALSYEYKGFFIINGKSYFWADGKRMEYTVPLELFDYRYEGHFLTEKCNFFSYDTKYWNYRKPPFWLRFFNVEFKGHYQSYKYFDKYKDLLIDYYFRPNIFICCELDDFKPSSNSIAISVRRGDYLKLNNLHTVLGMDYYERALAYLKKHVTLDKIYVFSDDIDWCKSNFKGNEFNFVEGDLGLQFFKLTKFKHVILSNSTFAWWGAYLNREIQNVIAPLDWFGPMNAHKGTLDLFPTEWRVM
jgi:hypothetical protein